IRIRGISSTVLSNDPIIILDGVRLTSRTTTATSTMNTGSATMDVNPPGFVNVGVTFAPGRLDDIDPNTIESIDVLRGPSAASLYGTEAANGVIVIKTRKGVVGPFRLNLTADNGWSYLPGQWPLMQIAWGHQINGTPISTCFLFNAINSRPNVADG